MKINYLRSERYTSLKEGKFRNLYFWRKTMSSAKIKVLFGVNNKLNSHVTKYVYILFDQTANYDK